MSKNKFSVISKKINFAELSDEDLNSKEFEILSAGKKIYRGKKIEIKTSDLSEMEKNFNENVVGLELAVDKNHDPDHQAYAWFSSVRKEGNKLLAKFKDYTDDGKKMFQQGVFKYFSVEFENNFEAIVDGTKKTFNNVLRGVALTNRPVDKAINPTFSENLFFNLSKNMEALKLFAESLTKKDIVTASEKEVLKTMVATLSEEEAKEIKEDVETIDDKPEEEEEKEEEKKEEGTELSESTQKMFAELKAENEVNRAENDKLKSKLRFAEISTNVEKELQLSETNSTGLSKEDTEKTSKFFATLSDSQIKEATSLLKSVKTVDFSEYGVADTEIKNKDTEATKLAEEKVKTDKVSFGQALKSVYSERPDLLPQD